MDLGNPASYLVLADGTPVLSSDGREVGKVEHVLADADSDVFDGVIVDMRAAPAATGSPTPRWSRRSTSAASCSP